MSEEKKVICSVCGNQHEEPVKFCAFCGAKIEGADAVDAPAEPVEKADNAAAESTYVPPAADPVYVEVPAQAVTATTYTTIDEGAPVKTGNGSPGFGIASMILGILSLLCCCFWPLSLICSIVAIVLGIIAVYNKYDSKGMAIAGIIMGGLAIVVLIGILVLAGSAGLMEYFDSYY